MAKVAPNHEEAKKLIQRKYFDFEDPTIPVFSFVGRLTLQKVRRTTYHMRKYATVSRVCIYCSCRACTSS
jgi:hypothetical protein